jgi:hypothetical protein
MTKTEQAAATAAAVALVCVAHQRQLEHSVASLLKGGGPGSFLPLPSGVVRDDSYPEGHFEVVYRAAKIDKSTLMAALPALEVAVTEIQKSLDDWVGSLEFSGVEPSIPPAETVREHLARGLRSGKHNLF